MPLTPGFESALHGALAPLGSPRQCALVNYPNHFNVGDHAIWLGTVAFLRAANIRIAYCCDLDDYSPRRLEAALQPGDPILLQGGGSFGDLWPNRQDFHEKIVDTHPHRAVFLLPQSIHFRDAALERRAAGVFNAHGGVTLFARDHASCARMAERFSHCRVHLAPDMALYLSGWLPAAAPAASPGPGTLLLVRNDLESLVSPGQIEGAVREDWTPYQRHWRWGRASLPLSIPVARWHRRLWSCGLRHPAEFAACSAWLRALALDPLGADLVAAPRCRLSLELLWYGCRQLRSHRAVVTDRLHAHVLATILGVPNVLLPNLYPKNQAFFDTWTSRLPWCRFAASPSAVPAALAAASAP